MVQRAWEAATHGEVQGKGLMRGEARARNAEERKREFEEKVEKSARRKEEQK